MYLTKLALALFIISAAVASPGQSTKTRCTSTKTKTTTSKYPTKTPVSCASGVFNIQYTLSTGESYYFVDYGNPSFVGSNDISQAGRYMLADTTLKSFATPSAVMYSVATPSPGPNPPPNGRALFQAEPGTLGASNGEVRLLRVTVTDQSTCSLAFTDGVRTAIGVAGFRGGPDMYIAPKGTVGNFQEAINVRAIPVR